MTTEFCMVTDRSLEKVRLLRKVILKRQNFARCVHFLLIDLLSFSNECVAIFWNKLSLVVKYASYNQILVSLTLLIRNQSPTMQSDSTVLKALLNVSSLYTHLPPPLPVKYTVNIPM